MFVLVILAIIVLLSSIKQVSEYERGIKFTMGKFDSIMKPGWNLVLPIFTVLITPQKQPAKTMTAPGMLH